MLDCTRAGGVVIFWRAFVQRLLASLACISSKFERQNFWATGSVVLKCSCGYNWYALRFGSQLFLTLHVTRASCENSGHRLRGKGGYAHGIEGTPPTFQYLERLTAAATQHTVRPYLEISKT